MNLKQESIATCAEKDDMGLFTTMVLGEIALKNRVVMAPMTRNRANADGCPNSLMAEYYAERASAGLIVAEGTWPSVTGQAYCRQPGIETAAQIQAWREVTEAVHQNGGKIVLQIMHAGRIGSCHIKPSGVETIAPAAIQAQGEIFTDSAGMQPFDQPRALSTQQVKAVVEEHRQAAVNAKKAGFDGVELHCTSGYLPMQFLCSSTNTRDDEYGGTAENRARFAIECLQAMAETFDNRVGLRINPGNQYNDTQDSDPVSSHIALLKGCESIELAYVHVMRSPVPDIDAFSLVKAHFAGAVILNDGFDVNSARQAIADGVGEAVSFARDFIANPDLVSRLAHDYPLTKFDRKTLYTAGERGYTDYLPAKLSE